MILRWLHFTTFSVPVQQANLVLKINIIRVIEEKALHNKTAGNEG
jgi:hypothetical protein